LAYQLTLSQPGGEDYAHYITNGTPRFSNLPTALGGALCPPQYYVPHLNFFLYF
jgi:hypothetical protein